MEQHQQPIPAQFSSTFPTKSSHHHNITHPFYFFYFKNTKPQSFTTLPPPPRSIHYTLSIIIIIMLYILILCLSMILNEKSVMTRVSSLTWPHAFTSLPYGDNNDFSAIVMTTMMMTIYATQLEGEKRS